ADQRRLKQILINLIGNANKFTNHGRVELRVLAEAGRALRIDVIDEGIGIPEAQREQVFEAFRQGSEGEARTHGGTGLGLAISRSLARLHGYELDVVSVVGEGSTFYLLLESTAPVPEHRPPRVDASAVDDAAGEGAASTSLRIEPREPDRSSRTVLVIEDDSDALNLAGKAIEQVGARVVSADSGASGFVIAQAVNPDLIVLDLGLPDMHGREVLRRLSADPALSDIPVVIYSANADGAEGLATASVLEKPVSLEEIAKVVCANLGGCRRVLVVDDDGDTREVLSSMLHALGVSTYEAGDGKEALQALDQVEVDLVLLDICMPNMSGFEFLA
ncbi:MAG: response regulator, partial [Myxococcales bacterium]|nr:response regulator [Myxococcales bacterium]